MFYNDYYFSTSSRYYALYDRPANIYIHNQSKQQFDLYTQHLDHGTFRKNPPTVIPPKETANFLVSERDASFVGPEGYIAYIITTGGNYGYPTEFHFHHPYGHGQSSYWAVVDPHAPIKVTVDHPHPGGHSQTVHFYIKDK